MNWLILKFAVLMVIYVIAVTLEYRSKGDSRKVYLAFRWSSAGIYLALMFILLDQQHDESVYAFAGISLFTHLFWMYYKHHGYRDSATKNGNVKNRGGEEPHCLPER
jgi:hypothetical protein